MIVKLFYDKNHVIRDFSIEELFNNKFLTKEKLLNYCVDYYSLNDEKYDYYVSLLSNKKKDGYYKIDLREYYKNNFNNFKFLNENNWEFLDEVGYEYSLSYIQRNIPDNLYSFYVLLDWNYQVWKN